MGLVQGGLPVVDAGRIQAHRLHVPLGHEPGGQLRVQAREVQLGHRLRAALGGAQVALGVGPALGEAGAEEHDHPVHRLAVLPLPPGDVVHTDLVVGVGCASRRDVHHHRRAHQALQWNLVRGRRALGKVDGRIQVGAAVL